MRPLTIIILIFSYLKVMYGVEDSNTDGTRSFEKSDVFTPWQAEDLLAEIKHDEVLPLIIYTDPENDNIIPPEDLTVAVIKDQRIVKGTKFIPKYRGNQWIMCPELNSDRKCFVPMDFEQSQILKCPEIEKAATFFNLNDSEGCGSSGRVGQNYVISYRICLEEKAHRKKAEEYVKFYKVCYDKNEGKTLYASHTIVSPELLDSNFLLRERELKYEEMMTNNQPNPSNYQTLKDSFDGTGLLNYKVQQLVPADDMPFALWRRATYQYVNADQQHEALFTLWNYINEDVRSYVLDFYVKSDGELIFQIHTGVFDVPSDVPRDDNQKSNMWVKMLHFVLRHPKNPGHHIRYGIAILMNNSIDTNDEESEFSEKNLETYCEEDLSLSDLKNQFERVKGHIRVCALTPAIAKLFGFSLDKNAELLHIPSINSKKDNLR